MFQQNNSCLCFSTIQHVKDWVLEAGWRLCAQNLVSLVWITICHIISTQPLSINLASTALSQSMLIYRNNMKSKFSWIHFHLSKMFQHWTSRSSIYDIGLQRWRHCVCRCPSTLWCKAISKHTVHVYSPQNSAFIKFVSSNDNLQFVLAHHYHFAMLLERYFVIIQHSSNVYEISNHVPYANPGGRKVCDVLFSRLHLTCITTTTHRWQVDSHHKGPVKCKLCSYHAVPKRILKFQNPVNQKLR